MTLSLRNGILTLAFSVLLLLTLGYGVLAFVLVSREGWTAAVGPGNLLQLLLAAAPAPLGGLAGFIFVRRVYRKSSAPEDFFFALFLASLGGESLLVLQAWLNLSGQAAYYTGLLTRVVWAFRFTGLSFLVLGGLFAFEFPYRKYANLVVGSLAAGIFLAVQIPLQSTSARNHLLYAVGDAPGLVLTTILLAIMVVGSFFLGARRPGTQGRVWSRAWAAVFFLAGWSLAIVAAPWGLLLAAPGVVLVAWKAEQNSQSI
ncbi:MAG TPA: hypothetical protein VMB23_09930 [Spirochaetia bacterium]|jgi:hypothetical protein|nr:hypothetical protein [Spirochaetia bacterium]